MFANAKQQQLEQINPKHYKTFKDFMFPSETTESTGTRIKHVDNEKTIDFIFPTEYKDTIAKTKKFLQSTKVKTSTESTTEKIVPEKRIENNGFVFPQDLTSTTNYSIEKSVEFDKRISLACTLTLCMGKK